ncbi:MAG TPA: GNAT family N-acetyltransferase [Cytophagales bacterium]|nr:GNAT family N-acetyltransferase [Cytophagales bacterium]
MNEFVVSVASEAFLPFAEQICKEIEESAKARGTGIAKRNPEYIKQKMREGKAVIALTNEGELAGFCYIESWGHDKFVANSGLIVVPKFRMGGLATTIKEEAFNLSLLKFPGAKLFGLTTSTAVMKINSMLGYKKVQFSKLTDDEDFWKGCSSCVNYDILTSTNRKHCLCTGMLYDPATNKEEKNATEKQPVDEEKPVENNVKTVSKSIQTSISTPQAFELDSIYA